jgi:glucan phosphoethanolaminetransferase (alkaline phosphatase superfamily)
VWGYTVLLSPLVFMGALAIVRGATLSDLRASARVIFPLMAFGILLLLPLLLLYWVAYRLIRHRELAGWSKWMVLSVVGALAIWLLYYGYDSAFFRQGGFGVYAWPLSYSAVLALAGWVVGKKDLQPVVKA